MNASSSDNYWPTFWNEHGHNAAKLDPQSQVFRTLNQLPIEQDAWQRTVEYVVSQFSLQANESILDLAGGNGLLAREMATLGHRITLVDVAAPLLDLATDFKGITTVCADMRDVDFEDQSFDHALLYAGLQYLTHAESAQLLKRVYRWLKPDGIIFLGDIPDVDRKWNFFDSSARRQSYFEGLQKGRPIVGTWFNRTWLQFLAEDVGFRKIKAVDQPPSQIYSWFRFDLWCQK